MAPRRKRRHVRRVNIVREVHGITPWQVTLRIRRMKRRLDKHIGQKVAEKRGHERTLTDFAYKA